MNYDASKVIVLQDDAGNEIEAEYIDSCEFEGEQYAMFLPVENDDDLVVIMKYDNVNSEYDSFVEVEDKRILQGVYNTLQEKYRSELEALDAETDE